MTGFDGAAFDAHLDNYGNPGITGEAEDVVDKTEFETVTFTVKMPLPPFTDRTTFTNRVSGVLFEYLRGTYSMSGIAVSVTEVRDGQPVPTEGFLFRKKYDVALIAWRALCDHPEPGLGCASCQTYARSMNAFYDALRAENERDAAEGYECVGREAECTVCGQSFNPEDENDLIHLLTTVPPGVKWGYTGENPEGPERYCGGRGVPSGFWR